MKNAWRKYYKTILIQNKRIHRARSVRAEVGRKRNRSSVTWKRSGNQNDRPMCKETREKEGQEGLSFRWKGQQTEEIIGRKIFF